MPQRVHGEDAVPTAKEESGGDVAFGILSGSMAFRIGSVSNDLIPITAEANKVDSVADTSFPFPSGLDKRNAIAEDLIAVAVGAKEISVSTDLIAPTSGANNFFVTSGLITVATKENKIDAVTSPLSRRLWSRQNRRCRGRFDRHHRCSEQSFHS